LSALTTDKFIDLMSRKGFVFQELIKSMELGVPKTSAFFNKDGLDYFIKASDAQRGWQIKREVFFYTHLAPKLNFPSNIKLPVFVNSFFSKGFNYLILEKIPNVTSLKSLEESHSKDFISISDELFSIKEENTSSKKEQKKLNSMYSLYRNVFEKINFPRNLLEKSYLSCNFNHENVLTHNDLNGNNVLFDGEKTYLIDCERWQFWNKIYEISRSATFSALHFSLENDLLLPLDTSYLKNYYSNMNNSEKQVLHLHLILDSARRIKYYEDELRHDSTYNSVLEYSFSLLKEYRCLL